MIGQIQGILIHKAPPLIMIDCAGVGYEIEVPMSTYYHLPDLHQKVTVLTHFVVREDAQLLYGFSTPSEREAFRHLLKVSGIGARTSLAILSGLSVASLGAAILQQDAAVLQNIPGIGKKTAERLLLELKGKSFFSVFSQAADQTTNAASTPSTGFGVKTESLQALMALGYNEKEANKALQQVDSQLDLSNMLKEALRFLNKGA